VNGATKREANDVSVAVKATPITVPVFEYDEAFEQFLSFLHIVTSPFSSLQCAFCSRKVDAENQG
jgi:hypothetical protein